MPPLAMMEPFRLKGVELKNRIVRSSIGGQLAAPDGTVTNQWRNFERRFARTGAAALISATVSVSAKRYSPLYYPNLASDAQVGPLRKAIAEVKAGLDCKYILQIGDPGAHTQTSLLPQAEDAKSASATFDLLYGYSGKGRAVTHEEIGEIVDSFAQAARRAREAGCDGVEITASKGYLIHQFLNPATNRRRDEYGGATANRFRFLGEVVTAVRGAVGADYLLGVRLSARDVNYLPLNVRWPPVWPPRAWVFGNGLPETTFFAQELERLGVDYLHVSDGFGFINPRESPGAFPVAEVKRMFNATRHLSRKAELRARFVNAVPAGLLKLAFGIGWGAQHAGENAALAAQIKKAVRVPIMANGGFQRRGLIEAALSTGACDLVSMARPLLANPDLLQVFATADEPARPCTFCNRCSVLTAVVPVGCYEPSRFDSQDALEAQVLSWVTESA